jgi:polyisoprenoid-binding protein YceI
MKLKSGNINVADGNITGGKFTIDMASITDTDLAPDDGKADLEGHLKSDDFFDVAKYPEGVFEITSVEKVSDKPDATHTITGNLTLKGVTKSVSIPASVVISNGQLAAKTPQFVIDRTQWGVQYGSGALGLAQDEIINDEVGLQLAIKAAK